MLHLVRQYEMRHISTFLAEMLETQIEHEQDRGRDDRALQLEALTYTLQAAPYEG